MTIPYPGGRQFEWYALDQNGLVAVLNTAGLGPLPALLLESDAAYDLVLEAIRALPPITLAQKAQGATTYDTEFQALAERGLFAFDWPDLHRPRALWSNQYELQAQPLLPVPLTALALPQEIRSWLTRIRIPSLDLRSTMVLPTDAQWQVGSWYRGG